MTTFTNHTFTTAQIPSAAVMQAVQDSIDAICPIGSYFLVHMTPPSSGTLVNGAWLGCDGTPVSTSTYTKLFNIIGYTYGGSGMSFNLPDFQGRTLLTSAAAGHADAQLGRNDGAILASRRPKHSHTVDSTHSHPVAAAGNSSEPSTGHTHSIPGGSVTFANTLTVGATRPYGAATTGLTSSGISTIHTHTISSTTTSTATVVTAVGASGLTDGPAYLVCCTALIRAL